MQRWMAGWTEGWMNVRMNGRVEWGVDRSMNYQMVRLMDERIKTWREDLGYLTILNAASI
jgi:hypothetical protein